MELPLLLNHQQGCLSPRLKKYLKIKGSPFTPESSKRNSPRLLLSKHLSITREDIANDSSTDSDLSPSQLSAFTSPVPADILLDDDSERSHQIIKKQGRPPKNQRKRNAATAPKFMPAVQQLWRLSLDVH